jgi:hypothetical protein
MGSAPLLPFSSVPTHGRRRLKITTMKLRLGQGGNRCPVSSGHFSFRALAARGQQAPYYLQISKCRRPNLRRADQGSEYFYSLKLEVSNAQSQSWFNVCRCTFEASR